MINKKVRNVMNKKIRWNPLILIRNILLLLSILVFIWVTISWLQIVIFNTITKEIELLSIPNHKDIYEKEVRPFEDCYVQNQEIILIPNLLAFDDLNLLNSSINLDPIVKSALSSTIGLIRTMA